ncbi:zinc finger BED domain-containing protein 5-like [Ascaphus truei]|uniref:zinc finger BED domain-containing protein 5-like n=1 Tax=Ascaphus truei TaxID=8439 RepID=UPI003F59514A
MWKYVKRSRVSEEDDEKSAGDVESELSKDMDQPSSSTDGREITKKYHKIFEKKVTFNERAREASYFLAELVAQKMICHTTVENLIMPAFKILAKTMLGKEAARQIAKIPVSNSTISRCVDDMSRDIEEVLSETLKNCNFAIQVDESTDITGKAQLLAFARFEYNGEIVENFLCCKELGQTCRGQDVCDVLSSYLESLGLSLDRCVGICTDGAPSMIDSMKGFVTLVKEKNPDVITTHRFLRREVLVSETTGGDLKQVLDTAVDMVNFIKQRPWQSRMFADICENMGEDHVTLLLHTEDRWLSRGKVLTRVFELREQLQIYFGENNESIFSNYLEDESWLLKLAYLADISEHLNTLNTNMQGPKENILTCTDQLVAFKNKIGVWKEHLSEGNYEMFPHFSRLQSNTMDNHRETIMPLIYVHMESLAEKLVKYFPSLSSEEYDWVRNPFTNYSSSSENTLSLREEEQLIDLTCDRPLRIQFDVLALDAFWISMKTEFPAISQKAINILLQFSTSYLCEHAFSCLTNIKTKPRPRLLPVEEELRVCVSKLRPRIKLLCSKSKHKFHTKLGDH